MKNTKLFPIIALILLVLTSTGCIGVNKDFRNIRTQILDNLDDDFDRTIEFSVGKAGFFLASKFVKLADDNDDIENVDEMLKHVSNVNIGIYDRLTNSSKSVRSLLNEVSNSMEDNNYSSVVKTIDNNEMVGIFIKDDDPEEITEMFAVILSDDELVMLKLNGNLNSLVETVIENEGFNAKFENEF
ncbi:MAG: DUF4252 domain-containing protein [Ignavibacteriae bacterium]|nr:DUF4252 domain-containing protein [Ignavibacteriota bacterium]